MISRALAVATLATATHLHATDGDDSFRAPDSILLKNGETVRGLIVKNTASAVTIQKEFGETSYPKSEIIRIRDEADMGAYFMESLKRGDLPAWRIIANDLRLNDAIRSLIQIPATTIDTGDFRNVPYLSFRVNRDIELNIYGDPNDPAGIELGIYGRAGNREKIRRALRAYLAGFLTTRAEVAALYGIPLEGGSAKVADLTFEVTPPTAPDAYGAWWISVFNRKDIDAARLSDAEYAKLTRPMDQVINRRGRVIATGWTKADLVRALRKNEGDQVLARGFYRDENGQFRVIGTPAPL